MVVGRRAIEADEGPVAIEVPLPLTSTPPAVVLLVLLVLLMVLVRSRPSEYGERARTKLGMASKAPAWLSLSPSRPLARSFAREAFSASLCARLRSASSMSLLARPGVASWA